ncbi:MAG: hypothetical protein M0R30_01895 [Methanoregula sp.]|jgi:hypothetical protein|uniref:hypothetical protein n=1 Tax=Methanoregula sp. TaxID=2052170 RepID=UPI0025F8F64B|nr:hypothetical protein [Methanoregula sp.]MCK9630367.1 hypothetical protein [Methanoregula sp.]
MLDPSITYFPVGNGDTSLIQLSNEGTILIDCNITNDSRDVNEESIYDVHEHLLSTLKKDNNGVPFVDAFILTHPDEDHCLGFSETFYTGDPAKYSETDKKNGLIRIDELWFTPRIFSPHEKDMCDTAKVIRNEAERRKKLYLDKKTEKISGNRIRIIGYSDNSDLEGLEEIITTPGNSINFVNGNTLKDFSFFVHAPFKKDTDSKWSERNDTSVVLQARFDIDGEKNAALAFFGGDSEYGIWDEIVQRSDEDTLKWDIFMAPHHCSWTFFNETPQEDNKKPCKSAIDLLNKKRVGAKIVASCDPIKDDDNNPPHFAAKEEYIKIVGKENFFVTGEYPPGSKKPLPLTFILTKNGPREKELSRSQSNSSKSAIRKIGGTPHTYG